MTQSRLDCMSLLISYKIADFKAFKKGWGESLVYTDEVIGNVWMFVCLEIIFDLFLSIFNSLIEFRFILINFVTTIWYVSKSLDQKKLLKVKSKLWSSSIQSSKLATRIADWSTALFCLTKLNYHCASICII